ncbi:MAG: PH domain-containing protein [Anaerolineae bacterium]|nr:PH domain-containing protein [Anaerolineae bacterium]
MNFFTPDTRVAFTAGVAAASVSAFIGVVLVVAALLVFPLSIAGLMSFVGATLFLSLSGLLAYQLIHFPKFGYSVDRNALVILWGDRREIIPMRQITQVLAGVDLEEHLRRALRVPLPGWWFGRAHHPEFGTIQLRATAPPADQVVIVAEGGLCYALSPYEVESFVEALRLRMLMGPTQEVAPMVLRPAWQTYPLWRDRAGLFVLAAALVLNVVVFGIAVGRYGVAPARVGVHFDATGKVDRFENREAIFNPPSIALFALAVNALFGGLLYHKRERTAALLLWGGSAVIQVLFGIAVLSVQFAPS